MGITSSKFFSHHSDANGKSSVNINVSGTSGGTEKLRICTPPMSKRKVSTDPRSATEGITRTPIEIALTPPVVNTKVASALPKYLQGKRYLETDFDEEVMETTPVKSIVDPRSPNVTVQRTPILVKTSVSYLTPKIMIHTAPEMETPESLNFQSMVLDPRSPATDFDRTPILKMRSSERICSLFEDAINVNVPDSTARLSFCETTTSFSIPEIQAVAEPIFSSMNESLSLESDTNVSKTSQNPSDGSNYDESSDPSDNDDTQITVIRNPNIFSSLSDGVSTWTECEPAISSGFEDSLRSEHQKNNDKLDSDISEIINSVMMNTQTDYNKGVASNDKIKVWRDSVSPKITEEARPMMTGNNSNRNSEEIIIEFDDEIVSRKGLVHGSKIPVRVETDKEKKVQNKRNQNGNKMEERKLYGDVKNPVDAVKNRTPLANRSNNHKQLSLVSGKSPQSKLRNRALTVHQENTPPHNDRFISRTKASGIQWDADTTVII